MRGVVLVVLVGCGRGASAPKATPPPVPVAAPSTLFHRAKSCTDAAFGIGLAAKDLHAPEDEVVPAVRARCAVDLWTQPAIDCFSALDANGDLDACIAKLPEAVRVPLLSDLRGAQQDQAAELAEVTARLTALSVGIASCDRFVQAVTRMMSCEGLATAARIQLGTETSEAWALPIDRLSLQDKAKMAAACNQSLSSLRHHATDLACSL